MTDKPTMKVDDNGNKFWHLNGEIHREDGPAIEYANGNKFWLLNDKLHREGGPALEWADGDKFWYLNGELQAIEWTDGSKSWYLNGKGVTEEEHKRLTSKESRNE